MQMYQVAFQTHYEDVIDCGKCLVCASNNDAAADVVRMLLDIPASRTVFTVTRVKGLFQLDRSETVKNNAARSVKSSEELALYQVSLVSGVRARSESHAWRKLGQALIDRSKHEKASTDNSIVEFDVSCERQEYRPRPSGFERQAIYKEKTFVAGGAARPR